MSAESKDGARDGSTPRTPKKDGQGLTPSELRTLKLFKAGLMVAQGNNESDIYAWMASKGFFPPEALISMTPKYIEELAIPNQHISLGVSYQDTIGEMWHSLVRRHREIGNTEAPELITIILGNLLERELNYQIKGRVNRNPDSDPYRSYVRDHVVLGVPGNMPETTQLYAELRAPLFELASVPVFEEPGDFLLPGRLITLGEARGRESQDTEESIQEIVSSGQRRTLGVMTAIWEIRHPGQSFFPAPATAPVNALT